MTFREELSLYINSDTKLFGIPPNVASYSTGNPILETGTAYVLLKKLDTITDADRRDYIKSIQSCANTDNSFLIKKPCTNDLVSHDDMIGLVAGYVALGGICFPYLVWNVIRYGNKHNWIFSTTGKFYWDAVAKPWHVGYYLLACNSPVLVNNLFLALSLLFCAFFNKSNASSKKLSWLISQTVYGQSVLIDWSIRIWRNRLLKTWGSNKSIFEKYYGFNHIFTKWISD